MIDYTAITAIATVVMALSLIIMLICSVVIYRTSKRTNDELRDLIRFIAARGGTINNEALDRQIKEMKN